MSSYSLEFLSLFRHLFWKIIHIDFRNDINIHHFNRVFAKLLSWVWEFCDHWNEKTQRLSFVLHCDVMQINFSLMEFLWVSVPLWPPSPKAHIHMCMCVMQFTESLWGTMELHPWWHPASVLESRLLDLTVSYMVVDANRDTHFYVFTLLYFENFFVCFPGWCCHSCSPTPSQELSPE